MGVYDLLPECKHIEMSVGYSASPGIPFRVYESSAWMHVHYAKAGQQNGNHYKWVIPSAFDTEKWPLRETPDDYAIFLGRVTVRKGMNELLEISRRMPDLPIHVYGPGDPSAWAEQAPPNLIFKGPVFGRDRADVVGRARCMLMPTVYIEPFGFSGVEAQLCGVPLIGPSYGAFQETIEEGVTGYRCHTLADWTAAIELSKSLDRRQIADKARSKYSKEVVGQQYDWVFKQLSDLSSRGWYGDISRKFARALARPLGTSIRKPRIWLYIPYFGVLPNYFQIYLNSLKNNIDYLSVIFITDVDLSNYQLPDNLLVVTMSLEELRVRASSFLKFEFGMKVRADSLIKQSYKLCDYKIIYPELFSDIGTEHGIIEDDFVGWGDCDVIYGKFCDFLPSTELFDVIGGFHGHLTAVRNIKLFTRLFLQIENLGDMLVADSNLIIDERAYLSALLLLADKNKCRIFYINKYFCDVVPICFITLFRKDHPQQGDAYFDAYHPEKNIDRIDYSADGKLTVFYEDLSFRESIYCHLQKRPMVVELDNFDCGFTITAASFNALNTEVSTV
jgi:hypothetical protein